MTPQFSLPRPAGKRLTSAPYRYPEPLNRERFQRSPFGISKGRRQVHVTGSGAQLSNYVDPPFQGCLSAAGVIQ